MLEYVGGRRWVGEGTCRGKGGVSETGPPTHTAAPRAAGIPTSRSCGLRSAAPPGACACAPPASRQARSAADVRAPGDVRAPSDIGAGDIRAGDIRAAGGVAVGVPHPPAGSYRPGARAHREG